MLYNRRMSPGMHRFQRARSILPMASRRVRIWLRALPLFVALMLAAPVPAQAPSQVILVAGDSISAGYGLTQGTGWVALLAAKLATGQLPYRVVNASITGDTTAGGRARLPALLAREKPAIIIIELGGNDGLRGGSLAATRANLDAMIVAAQRAGAKVLLIGTELPPNYGPAYTRDYAAIFSDLAQAHHTALVPSLFAGFGERNDMFQADRIHPAPAAQSLMLDSVWKALQPMLARAK
jgi:acyl-CoA thioesterase-1